MFVQTLNARELTMHFCRYWNRARARVDASAAFSDHQV